MLGTINEYATQVGFELCAKASVVGVRIYIHSINTLEYISYFEENKLRN